MARPRLVLTLVVLALAITAFGMGLWQAFRPPAPTYDPQPSASYSQYTAPTASTSFTSSSTTQPTTAPTSVVTPAPSASGEQPVVKFMGKPLSKDRIDTIIATVTGYLDATENANTTRALYPGTDFRAALPYTSGNAQFDLQDRIDSWEAPTEDTKRFWSDIQFIHPDWNQTYTVHDIWINTTLPSPLVTVKIERSSTLVIPTAFSLYQFSTAQCSTSPTGLCLSTYQDDPQSI